MNQNMNTNYTFFSKILIVLVALISMNGAQAQNGSLDLTFDSDGKVTTHAASKEAEAQSILLQKDGKIIVAGYRGAPENDMVLVRYNENGSLDKSFDTDGFVTTAISGSNVRAYSVALQNDGKILAAGSSSIGVTEVMILVRYNINGSLDTSFNHTGILTSAIGAVFTEVYAIAIQKDGKIVVTGGVSNDAIDFNIAVIRFNNDGTLDNTFDVDGIVVTDLGSLYDFANSLVIQNDGKIVVTAYSKTQATRGLMVIVRYNSDGSLDNTFDQDGKLYTIIVNSSARTNSMVLQSDQKLVLGAATDNGNGLGYVLARYNTDGSVDTTFDLDGYVFSSSFGSFIELAYTVALQSDEKILVTGYRSDASGQNFMIKRYHKDGSIDDSFGQQGKVITDFGNADDEAKAIALQSDDKIIVAGISFHAGVTDFAIARYNNMITSTKKVGDKKIQISVFPNPTSKYLNISLNNDDHFNFEIVNAVGVVVMKGKNTQQIDVSNLKEGPYLLSIRYKHNVYCQKWIKLGAK